MKEFSSEITTGMSAPPIGITIVIPKVSATARSATNRMPGLPVTSRPASTSRPTKSAILTKRSTADGIAFSEMMPCSFAKATALPLNDTEPMIAPNSCSGVADVSGIRTRLVT